MTALCSLFFLLSYFTLKLCSAKDTITATEFLKDPEIIASNNNTFTLGFFSPPNSTNKYVGIWYSKPSVKDVVWVANRNNPLNDSSGILRFSKDGDLQVLNGKKQVLWSTNVSNLETGGNFSAAQILDSGNLVLTSKEVVIWQSFDDPTDTFLPNMKLRGTKETKQRKMLQSWRSPSDPSDGRFTSGLDTFILPQLVVWDEDCPHWRSGPWNGNFFVGVQFNFIDFINAQIVISSDKQGTLSMRHFYPNKSLLSTYMLSTEGKFTQIWWDGVKKSWEVEWQQPEKECDMYGKCGAFGTCNSQRAVICQCLKGFEPQNKTEWSTGEWSSGCVRKKQLQCKSGNVEGDGFLRLKSMKVPDHAEWKLGLDQDGCRSKCLSNCSCLAYAFDTGIGCMTWSTRLVDIQEFSVSGLDLYIRLARSELVAGIDNKVKVIIAVTGSLLGIAVIDLIIYCLWKQRAHRQVNNTDVQKSIKEDNCTTGDRMNDKKLEELPLFKFETLVMATNNFSESNQLGRGGFGTVYKGKLEDGQEIAVKRLSTASRQGLEEFMNEVKVISKLQHRNLVRLLGCSVEGQEKILVYEYLPNKSLDAYLFVPENRKILDWRKRFNVIEGICRGLQYLHRDSRLRIIHRDLKASNILLDKDHNPKISDFGMARIFGGEEDQADTRRVVGTYGYMSPEYAMEGKFSEKSDVFSFGVLLLEIISGERNSTFFKDEQSWSLLVYAWKLWNENSIISLIDSVIFEPQYEADVVRCVHVGLLCVQEFARNRPTISDVISMLNGEISELPQPDRPGFAHISKDMSISEETRQDFSANYVSITGISGR